MAALAANESRDFAQALELTEAALGFPRPAESPETRRGPSLSARGH